ncbi:uncharacterized protein LOC130614465 [Hydractinia symbiolongicarpus]|uniref:uncharacterized protein LOC130614465 n=1 Tax=Hydractinia symbiolongicarpus TaxID=13093 RepID=UPI00254F9BD4|nr:uncharacterized protein LOC130614465 [Hydractinia symbiolongicarpus]
MSSVNYVKRIIVNLVLFLVNFLHILHILFLCIQSSTCNDRVEQTFFVINSLLSEIFLSYITGVVLYLSICFICFLSLVVGLAYATIFLNGQPITDMKNRKNNIKRRSIQCELKKLITLQRTSE